MWKDKFKQVIDEKKSYGESINRGASEVEIQNFAKELLLELDCSLPDDYYRFFSYVNGIEFNGYIVYGIDKYLVTSRTNQLINGLIENNKIWYENEWLKKFIFLGESNSSWYVYDPISKLYLELDNPSGRVVNEFLNWELLMETVLGDALL